MDFYNPKEVCVCVDQPLGKQYQDLHASHWASTGQAKKKQRKQQSNEQNEDNNLQTEQQSDEGLEQQRRESKDSKAQGHRGQVSWGAVPGAGPCQTAFLLQTT